WSDSPSSSSDQRRRDVITIDPRAESPHSSSEGRSIEILPEASAGMPEKKKTHLGHKGRDTNLVSMPSDETDIVQAPVKSSARPTPKRMIAAGGKGTGTYGEDTSMEINLEGEKSGSSLEMGKEKKAGSSLEISLPSTSDSSLEIGQEEKPGSSAEI